MASGVTAAAHVPPMPLPRLLAPGICRPDAVARPVRAWRARRGRRGRGGVKKLLNTLYVTTEVPGLRKDGETVVAEIDGVARARVPLHLLGLRRHVRDRDGVPRPPRPLRRAVADRGAARRAGNSPAGVKGPQTGNVLLRRAQYDASRTPEDARAVRWSGSRQSARGVAAGPARPRRGQPPEGRAVVEAAAAGWRRCCPRRAHDRRPRR